MTNFEKKREQLSLFEQRLFYIMNVMRRYRMVKTFKGAVIHSSRSGECRHAYGLFVCVFFYYTKSIKIGFLRKWVFKGLLAP